MNTRSPSLTLALALAPCACTPDAQDPTVTAAASLQRSLEMDGALDLLGPGGPVAGDLLPLGLACDASPELNTASVCDYDLVHEAHFAWTDCIVTIPATAPTPPRAARSI